MQLVRPVGTMLISAATINAAVVAALGATLVASTANTTSVVPAAKLTVLRYLPVRPAADGHTVDV
jgi:hypothetical protein